MISKIQILKALDDKNLLAYILLAQERKVYLKSNTLTSEQKEKFKNELNDLINKIQIIFND